jgi:mono/diheme cytochrome c family protein
VHRALKALLLATALGAAVALASACGSEGVQVDDRGAQLFADRCSGCHTLAAAATHGSVGERISGPNLNYRRETETTVLYAIRNGGFSGAIMPQNIVVGEDAEAVASFVAEYAGKKAKSPPAPQPQNPTPSEIPGDSGTSGKSGKSGNPGKGTGGN